MDRRTALATAGAIVIVTFTGAAAMGANLDVLDRATADPVGALQPNDPELTTVVVEPAPAADVPAAPAGEPVGRGADGGDDDGEYEDEYEHDDEYEREDDRDDDESGGEHEYEGRDDDD